jgi:hypothetical protein
MADFHHNMFYFYSGAEKSDFDRQLENNTTKALINVLEYCAPVVTIKFLGWLGVEATEPIKYELQKAKISIGKIEDKKRRFLIGLVASKSGEVFGEQNKSDKTEAARECLPDAWIYGNDFVVLIESKIIGSLNPEQTQNELNLLCVPTIPKIFTWIQIHKFFRNLSKDLIGMDKWIVNQFTEYLEDIGMSEFSGFKPDIFDYFVNHDNDDKRAMVRSTASSFAEKVLEKLKLDNIGSYYSECNAGYLSDDHFWVAFFDKKADFRKGASRTITEDGSKLEIKKKEYFGNRAHQTITGDALGLDIKVNVELKPAITKLRNKINAKENERRFRDLVKAIPDPYSIRLEERIQGHGSSYYYYPVTNIEGSYFKRPETEVPAFAFVEDLLNKITLPYFMLTEHISKEKVLELSRDGGNELIDEIIRIIITMQPLVQFINS